MSVESIVGAALRARLADGPDREPRDGPATSAAGIVHAAAGRALESPPFVPRVERPGDAPVATAATQRGTEDRTADPHLHADPSDWAGLWLLLPILLRAGLADDDAPLDALAGALQAAAGRFHIAPDDPLHGAIAALEAPAPASDAWLRRARLAAVRDARLPLRRIARRRGGVLVSDTRIDVVFPAEAADVRIRRAGFDLDPGFLPWLGRSVRFHYA